ncbi:MAG TPA: hypothetical protein VGE72_11210 [Azospirillum sp.]
MTDVPERRVPIDGPPVREMPVWGARRTLAWGVCDCIEGGSIETHFQLTDHVLSVNLGESHCDIALESDRFRRVVIPPGGLSFYPSGTRAKIIAPNSGAYLAVTISSSRFEDVLMEEFGIDHVRGVRPVAGQFDSSAHAIAAMLGNSFSGTAPLAPAGLEAAATLLALHAIRSALIEAPAADSQVAQPDLGPACAYIEQHLSDARLGTRTVAHAVGIAPATLWLSFRTAFGKPPLEYIRQRRALAAGQEVRVILERQH